MNFSNFFREKYHNYRSGSKSKREYTKNQKFEKTKCNCIFY